MLKSYDEMRKIDVSKWTEKRDGADYLNWAKVIDLLHENGATKVHFEPLVNENGSSLIMTNQEFKDSKGGTNRVYETAVKIKIDEVVRELDDQFSLTRSKETEIEKSTITRIRNVETAEHGDDIDINVVSPICNEAHMRAFNKDLKEELDSQFFIIDRFLSTKV